MITGCDHGFGRQLTEELSAQGAIVFAGCLLAKSVSDLKSRTSSLKRSRGVVAAAHKIPCCP